MLSLRLDLFGRAWLLLDLWPKPEEPAEPSEQVCTGVPVLELADGDDFGFGPLHRKLT